LNKRADSASSFITAPGSASSFIAAPGSASSFIATPGSAKSNAPITTIIKQEISETDSEVESRSSDTDT
jgi:hypothetical protein